ncbi:MAG: molybdopterin cofactor-binding domain-containing protein [Myxococcota bacterium]|nr:molybdopterin cofactor-binding domain-containing protein [Myxococcota bacterium]
MGHELDRRRFLKTTAASSVALIVACSDDGQIESRAIDAGSLDDGSLVDMDVQTDGGLTANRTLQTWIRIDEEETIHIAMHKAEMGQGIHTALPLIVAEELDAAVSQIKVTVVGEMGDYNLRTGLPMTSASNSVSSSFQPFRRVGASAKHVLKQAAAARWNVDIDLITTRDGACYHPNGDRLSYGALVDAASLLQPPDEPQLKSFDEFRLIGKDQARFIDAEIVDGRAVFGIDSAPDGALYAAIRHAPTPNGVPMNVDTLSSSNADVRSIVALPNAIAVVASSFWTAKNVVETLPVEFLAPDSDREISSAAIESQLIAGLQTDGNEILTLGDVTSVFAASGSVQTSDYFVPHLAHVPLEPVNATVRIDETGCDIWLPTQAPTYVQRAVAETAGLELEQVRVHATLLGGGFGRKVDTDYAIAAVQIAQSVGETVQLIWSREEDIRRDRFRPAFSGRLSGVIDEEGRLAGFEAINCGDSVLGFGAGDPLSAQGLNALPYEIANQRIVHVYQDSPIESGFWRSIGHSQNTFFAESFIDEMAHHASRDPLEFRLSMLTQSPRIADVVRRAAELGRWGQDNNPNIGQGLALCVDYGSILAVVADVSVDGDTKEIRVHKLSAAVDCGLVIQPTGVRAQIEGGLLFGLSAALFEEITLEAGSVQQSNFFDYPVLYGRDAPDIQVDISISQEPPGGVGEIAVGPVAPAIANAIHQLVGIRLRRLPLQTTIRQDS